MKHIIAIPFVLILISCQQEEYPKCPEIEDVKEEAVEKKPSAESIKEILDYVNEKTKDMVIMQQYFIGFLKRGASRNQNEQEANEIQK